MSEKLSFILTNREGEIDEFTRVIGCFEEIERIFSIEFAGGIENGVPLFYSDVRWTDKEDEYLSKYDGEVIEYMIRLNGGQVIDTRVKGCRFDIMYDSDYRYNGTEQFSNPKIITRGVR